MGKGLRWLVVAIPLPFVKNVLLNKMIKISRGEKREKRKEKEQGKTFRLEPKTRRGSTLSLSLIRHLASLV